MILFDPGHVTQGFLTLLEPQVILWIPDEMRQHESTLTVHNVAGILSPTIGYGVPEKGSRQFSRVP